MPWIEVFPLEKARGVLRKEYDAALKRAGRIWNIVSIMSQNPRAMKTSMDLYSALPAAWMWPRKSLCARGSRRTVRVKSPEPGIPSLLGRFQQVKCRVSIR